MFNVLTTPVLEALLPHISFPTQVALANSIKGLEIRIVQAAKILAVKEFKEIRRHFELTSDLELTLAALLQKKEITNLQEFENQCEKLRCRLARDLSCCHSLETLQKREDSRIVKLALLYKSRSPDPTKYIELGDYRVLTMCSNSFQIDKCVNESRKACRLRRVLQAFTEGVSLLPIRERPDFKAICNYYDYLPGIVAIATRDGSMLWFLEELIKYNQTDTLLEALRLANDEVWINVAMRRCDRLGKPEIALQVLRANPTP